MVSILETIIKEEGMQLKIHVFKNHYIMIMGDGKRRYGWRIDRSINGDPDFDGRCDRLRRIVEGQSCIISD